jgi:hypothetical protein
MGSVFYELLKENGEEGNIQRTSENNGYLTVQPWVEDPTYRQGKSRNSKIKKQQTTKQRYCLLPLN